MKTISSFLNIMMIVAGTMGCQREKFSSTPAQAPAPAVTQTSAPWPGSAQGPKVFPPPAPLPLMAPPSGGSVQPLGTTQPWLPGLAQNPGTFFTFSDWTWEEDFFAFFQVIFIDKTIAYLGISDEFTRESSKYEHLMIHALLRLGFHDFIFENESAQAQGVSAIDGKKWTDVTAAQNQLLKTLCSAACQSELHVQVQATQDFITSQNQIATGGAHDKIAFIGHNRALGAPLVQAQRPELLSIMMTSGHGKDSSVICATEECRVSALNTPPTNILRQIGEQMGGLYILRTAVIAARLPMIDFRRTLLQSDKGPETTDIVDNADFLFYVEHTNAL